MADTRGACAGVAMNKFKCPKCGGSGHDNNKEIAMHVTHGVHEIYDCPSCNEGHVMLVMKSKKLHDKCNGTGVLSIEACSCLDGWVFSTRPLTEQEVCEIADYYEVEVESLMEIYQSGAAMSHIETGQPVSLAPWRE